MKPVVVEVDGLKILKNLFAPRRYGQVAGGNYGNVEVWANELSYCVNSALHRFQIDHKMMLGQINALHLAYKLAELKSPLYFISPELCRAIMATSLPKEMEFGELEWPVEALTFAYPVNLIKEYVGFNVEIPFVSGGVFPHSGHDDCVRRVTPELELIIDVPTINVDSPRTTVTFMDHLDFVKQSVVAPSYHGSHRLNRPIKDIDVIEFVEWGAYSPDALPTPNLNIDMAGEKVVSRKVVALFFKTLVVMSTLEPRYIEREVKLRDPVVKRGVTKKALWAPNFVGRSFTLKKSSSTGTHASPEYHVRRRHAVRQAIGPRDKVVLVSSLPRTADGQTDWDKVTDEQKQAFWKSHKTIIVEEQWLGVKDDDASTPA